MGEPSEPEDEQKPPLLRIVRGNPTPEDVAALVAVVSALANAQVDEKQAPRSEWAAPVRRLRGAMPTGWRASALPR